MLENLTLRLYQQEARLKSRAQQSEKVTAYIASSKIASSKKPGGTSDQKSSLTFEQRQARRKEIEEKKKTIECHNCGQTGHWVRECPHSGKEDAGKKEEPSGGKKTTSYKAFVANTSQLLNDGWYADSVCTQHMTDQRSWFQMFQPTTPSAEWSVEGIGGAEIRAEEVGDILVRVKTTSGYEITVLSQVLFVPNFGRSLFSCYRAAQRDIYTLHMKDGCSLIQNGNVVMMVY